jgi:cell division protein FtsI (penicillin-binding protein 3)
VIAMVLSVFGARLFQLQALDASAYAEMASAEGTVRAVLPAQRGAIVDRDGRPFAESVDARMVVADPTRTDADAAEIARFLSDQLDVDYFDTLERLRRTDTRFQYIARRVPATVAADVMARADDRGYVGLDTRLDPARAYPAGDVGANLVGFLGTPDPRAGTRPLAGLELTFDELLSGTDGSEQYQVGDGAGNRVPLGDSATVEPVDGRDLRLTIDQDLQWYAQRVLRQALEDTRARSGVIVVQDTRTGELLAVADAPTFDAADPLASDEDDLGSRALSDVFEPGSVQKVLTAASLVDDGEVTPRTRIVVPPLLHRQDRTIKDWFPHGEIGLTMAGVIAQSSNIGTIRAADQMAPERLRAHLAGFGLGSPTRIGVRGEAPGILPGGDALTSQVKDRMAFGQSLSVNAVQMTAAINTVANGGLRVDPSLVRGSATTDEGLTVGTDTAEVRRVVSEESATATMRMMEQVVDEDRGVAPAAAVPGYRVAGKTGTAQRVGEECGCYDGTYTVSFGGFAPADDPRFTVYVALHAPAAEGGGGSLAGPLFRQVIAFALRRYGVPPTGTRPSRLPVEWDLARRGDRASARGADGSGGAR